MKHIKIEIRAPNPPVMPAIAFLLNSSCDPECDCTSSPFIGANSIGVTLFDCIVDENPFRMVDVGVLMPNVFVVIAALWMEILINYSEG